MAAPTPKNTWGQYFRGQFEASWGAGGGTENWNIGGNGGGATGWRDIPVINDSVRITPTEAQIFAPYAAGKRATPQQPPVPGMYESVGTFEMPFIPELMYPYFRSVMGGISNVETAGSAAKSSVAFASLATLDTQPDGTEMLKFVIASSTAASGAAINIIQSAATVETITIGDNAGTVNGTYYSKGAYDGSVNAITFTVAGTVTAGTVVVSGVDYVTNTFTMANTVPSLKLEEAGQPKSASDSGYYTGVMNTDLVLNFDRTAADGLLTATTNFVSKFPTFASAGTWANDAALYYHPFAGVTASLTKGGAAFDKVQSLTLTINGGNGLFHVASGGQDAGGPVYGPQEVTTTFTILPEDATEWDAFVGQTVGDYHIIFTSPLNIVDSTKWLLTIELTKAYIETYAENVQDTLFGADMTLRTIDDATDGVVKATMLSRMPV